MKRAVMCRYLDDPERVAWFTIDEVVILLVPIVVGIMSSMLAIGILVGALGVYGLRKVKGGDNRNYGFYALYWYLPSSLFKTKFTPPSYMRVLVG